MELFKFFKKPVDSCRKSSQSSAYYSITELGSRSSVTESDLQRLASKGIEITDFPAIPEEIRQLMQRL